MLTGVPLPNVNSSFMGTAAEAAGKAGTIGKPGDGVVIGIVSVWTRRTMKVRVISTATMPLPTAWVLSVFTAGARLNSAPMPGRLSPRQRTTCAGRGAAGVAAI